MDFGLFYFANNSAGTDGYRLLLEGARFADTHGFTSVWTPERHFHPFGGSYPNPAVTGAAVAAVTERVQIRSGSVVAPLHHPLRIAEEWSVVDNLSGGRVGLSFASGWHAADFALAPHHYADRKEVLARTIADVRELWRGGALAVTDGDGEKRELRTYPEPVRAELPVWLTAAGNPETFREAGETGAGVLTHLLGQSAGELAEKIAVYRAALPEGDPGHVVLMLHTFLGTDRDEVREIVREPFSAYLRTSLGLLLKAAGDIMPDLDPDDLTPEDVDFLVSLGFERYFDTGGLFGTVEDNAELLRGIRDAGVDEVACLIDFIDDADTVLGGLEHLDALRRAWA
ncbi:MupA/Atu3671 family FMN-dependent luciferase-like monooxygenase [Streptomyces acidiscabies]|uniref:LLM class flavin-dependent oxidoreductase n=1 Tax=Streptomyces acidiscabies TaxID=42234 RepID=A0AAP6B992_9ACTN|nr:MupA/Atu3671 family FMN-dependent luciferase-like monooxygenase [Streptomyces acidiscabies]MBZ3916119.1 LLM class flavin-dependent oxidoreductase [Streptomyces acidiscabies]MDX2960511.1 LLM class flavin-dependent oxidoreductase [Streptomyces acidiscabies]MDX3017797.1 LLM class flavin-dependent oxidoreductase [Streptomyces acidiscabies]MDX3791430.1 LLM class flavin-dependent oxidoreductase [Streptomyces acidiscabies]